MLSWLQSVPRFLYQYVSFGLKSIIQALCLFARNQDKNKVQSNMNIANRQGTVGLKAMAVSVRKKVLLDGIRYESRR
jgi:hypothetical protein